MATEPQMPTASPAYQLSTLNQPLTFMLTSVDRLLFVRQVPIFEKLRDDFIVRLASVMDGILSFPANYAIFKQGERRAIALHCCFR